MLSGALDELEPVRSSLLQDDMIIVDGGMLDVRPLLQLLQLPNNLDTTRTTTVPSPQQRPLRRPKILMFMHENQLTTPFTKQDRDLLNQTHWHYGMINLMSSLTVDGVLFNSKTHRQAFCEALPQLVKQQCPVDSSAWFLEKIREAESKFTTLHYGLDLDGLSQPRCKSDTPVILWNARLEEDKDPNTFIEILLGIRPASFRLVVLGNDPSKDQSWYRRLRTEFANELLFIGWCSDRTEYAAQLHKADVVVSTARHETFGISVVESVYCGALPLLPQRLSYPELFTPETFAEQHLYKSTGEAIHKLKRLLQLFHNKEQWTVATSRCKQAIARFRWQEMGTVYDEFFSRVAENGVQDPSDEATSTRDPASDFPVLPGLTVIADPKDSRVQLYRPKSERNAVEYHCQLQELRKKKIEPVLHGGRRATVRMLEAIGAGAKIKPLSFLTTHELARQVLEPLHQKYASQVPLYTTGKDTLDIIRGQKLNSGDAILAMIQFPIPVELEVLLKNPPLLILEDVRNAENVGSILRTAFCLGINSVVASNTTWAALRDSRSARCSMGTMYYQKFYKADSLRSTIQTIRQAGIQAYGIEIGAEARIISPHGEKRNWAMVLGNEDAGMSQEIRQVCHEIVYVPQATGDSLNVAAAAAIAMFELGRDCPLPEHDGRAACT